MAMSKSVEQDTPQRCAECERIVVLTKDERRQLTVQCGCEERQVKVRKATPGEWE